MRELASIVYAVVYFVFEVCVVDLFRVRMLRIILPGISNKCARVKYVVCKHKPYLNLASGCLNTAAFEIQINVLTMLFDACVTRDVC